MTLSINKNEYKKTLKLKKSSGFSILELLLVVSVTTFALTGLFSFIQTAIDDRTDAKVASEIKELQTAAENYVSLNFIDTLMMIPNIGDITEITIPTMQSQDFLTNAYDGVNSYSQQMRVYARHITNTADSGSVIEILTVSLDLGGINRGIDNNRIINAANKGGPSVGTLTNLALNATCCVGQFVGSSKTWTVDRSDFIAAVPAYTAVADDDGGYMAAYGRVANPSPIENVNYLFREPVAAIPDANTMNTNLDMNGNRLSNASVIVADSLNIAPGNNMNILGNGNNIIQSPYVLAVEESLTTDTLSVQNSRSLSSGKGNLFIEGDNGINTDLQANRLIVDNPAGNSAVIALNINDDNDGMILDVTDQMNFTTLSTTSDLTINNDVITTNIIFNGGGFTTNGVLQIYQVNGDIDNLNANVAAVENLRVNGDATINTPIQVIEPINLPGNATAETITSQGSVTIGRCREPSGAGDVRCQ